MTDLVPVPRPKMKTGSVRPPEPKCPEADGHDSMAAHGIWCALCGANKDEILLAFARDQRARDVAGMVADHLVGRSSMAILQDQARLYLAHCMTCGWRHQVRESLSLPSGGLQAIERAAQRHVEEERDREYLKQRMSLGCPHPRMIRRLSGTKIELLPCTWCGF